MNPGHQTSVKAIVIDVVTLWNYNHCGRFEWDESKRKTNLRKHGIDFVGIEKLFDGYTVTVEDATMDYGEHRFISLGILEGRTVVVVHTETEEEIRVISVRKATKHEEKSYFGQVQNKLETSRRSPRS